MNRRFALGIRGRCPTLWCGKTFSILALSMYYIIPEMVVISNNVISFLNVAFICKRSYFVLQSVL